jgi:hypothetical protein
MPMDYDDDYDEFKADQLQVQQQQVQQPSSFFGKRSYLGDFGDSLSEKDNCVRECNSDLNCTGLLKCCSNGCGASCTVPIFDGNALNISFIWRTLFLPLDYIA